MNGRGTALKTDCACGTYSVKDHAAVPYVETVAVQNDNGGMTLFAVNRSLTEECELELSWNGEAGYHPVQHLTLTGDDLKKTNTEEDPLAVAPQELPVNGRIVLPAKSWNMIRFDN